METDDPSARTFFTVIQYDKSGNQIAVDELMGMPGGNFWNWKQESILVQTRPNTVSIRIRFGLSTAAESYLDVDALR